MEVAPQRTQQLLEQIASDKTRPEKNIYTLQPVTSMCRYVLPVEPNVQKLVHVFYTQPSFIAPYAKVKKALHCHDVRYWSKCQNSMCVKICSCATCIVITDLIYVYVWVSFLPFNWFIVQLVQWAEAILVERDIRVWNSKRFVCLFVGLLAFVVCCICLFVAFVCWLHLLFASFLHLCVCLFV